MDPDPLIDYYSRRAAEYERIYSKPERQADLSSLKIRVAEFARGHDVLEIACGTGYWTEALAPAARSVVATDASRDVLDVARSKSYPADRVRFEIADAFDPARISGHFTAGFAGFWWSHVEKNRIDPFLDAFHAKLGHGARVLIIDNRLVEGSSTPIARRDAVGNTYQIRKLDDGSTQEVLKNFPSPEELRQAVEGRAAEISVTELSYFWCLGYVVR